ncbi:Cellobiose phosphorylase, partial [mine drainage metagenome]
SWLLPWVRTPDGQRVRNPLSALSRWKILDNLRRSLVPVALLVLLLLGWFAMAQVAAWTVAVLAVVFVPPLLAVQLDLFQKPRDVLLGQHVRAALRSSGEQAGRLLLTLAWLPHEALYSMDAILRTLWRMMLTRRMLLQWNPSQTVERGDGDTLAGSFKSMAIGPALALLAALALLLLRPGVLLLAAPMLLLW